MFRLQLSVSREAFFWIRRERSFHIHVQKRRGHQQWRVRNLETESIRSSEYRRVCKVEDSHRDKTEQYPWHIYSRECLSCTEFFIGLGASGESETEVWCGQFYFFFFSFLGRGEQYSSVCYEGSGQRKQAGQKGENCSSPGVTEWEVASFTVASVERYFRTKLIRQSWFGGLTDEALHGQCAVKENTEAFDRVRDRDCGIKLKGVDRNGGQFLSCSDEFSVFSLLCWSLFVSSSFGKALLNSWMSSA